MICLHIIQKYAYCSIYENWWNFNSATKTYTANDNSYFEKITVESNPQNDEIKFYTTPPADRPGLNRHYYIFSIFSQDILHSLHFPATASLSDSDKILNKKYFIQDVNLTKSDWEILSKYIKSIKDVHNKD